MRVYTPNTNKGRTLGGDDTHHRTADQSKKSAKISAKTQRHAARQHSQNTVKEWS